MIDQKVWRGQGCTFFLPGGMILLQVDVIGGVPWEVATLTTLGRFPLFPLVFSGTISVFPFSANSLKL